MKFLTIFTVAYVAIVFETCYAFNLNYLQDFMHTNLSSPPPSSSGGSTIPASPVFPAALVPRPVCPREVNISWQLRPPFTLEKNTSEVNEEQQIDGIFHQALDFALGECCAFYRGDKPVMRYLAMSDNSSALHHNIFSDDSSLVFPIADNLYIGDRRRFINILDSPGVILIRRETSRSTDRGGQLFKAILETWPIVVLSLLMSSLAGICIWMLVSLNF